MNLYITGSSFLNSEYKDSDGKTMYKVSTPNTIKIRTSIITRLIQSPDESENPEQGVLDGRFVHLARIEFRPIGSSFIHYKGTEHDTKEMFRKERWGRHRLFTASDGKEYRWILGHSVPSYILDNSTKETVAKFHRKPFFSKKLAYLEVYPGAGMGILDEILVSFVYIEKLRRNKNSG